MAHGFTLIPDDFITIVVVTVAVGPTAVTPEFAGVVNAPDVVEGSDVAWLTPFDTLRVNVLTYVYPGIAYPFAEQ